MVCETQITEIVDFNPSRPLKRNATAPFIDMAALPEHQRDIASVSVREFTGGGSRFCNGDTLFARITPCLENGKTAKVNVLPAGAIAHGSTEFIVMAAREPDFDEDYVYYLARHPDFRRFAEARMEGTSGRQRVSWQSLSEFAFPFPPREERKKIGCILRSLDDRICLNRHINKTLEAMAQAIFKSWFVDFDPVKAKIAAKAKGCDPLRAAMTAICGKTDAELDTLPRERFASLAATAALFPNEIVNSELGEIPMGWSAAPFGAMLAHAIGGDWGSDAPGGTNDARVAIIRGTDLPDLDQARANRVPIRYTTQKKLATRRIQVGDIVLEVSGGSRDQPTGRSFRMTANAMNEFDCPVEPASFCRLLRPVSPEIGVILGLHLSHIYQQGKTWEYQNQSTGIANFQTAHFLEAELVASPPKAVADAFFKMVNPILERRHDPQGRRLAELRDALLPKLLSGELPVNSTEVEEVTA